MERSDKFQVDIDEYSGLISYKHKHIDTFSYQLPYTMKLLLHELQAMSWHREL